MAPRMEQSTVAIEVMHDPDRDTQLGVQIDDALSHVAPETPLWTLARVAQAGHRMAAHGFYLFRMSYPLLWRPLLAESRGV
jgi:hypothetical protein